MGLQEKEKEEDTADIKKSFDHPMGTNKQVMKLNRKLFNGQWRAEQRRMVVISESLREFLRNLTVDYYIMDVLWNTNYPFTTSAKRKGKNKMQCRRPVTFISLKETYRKI